MEQHFLEAELQLQGMKGEMAARFDLTRAKMAATVRESEELVRQRNEVLLRGRQSLNEHAQNGNGTGDVNVEQTCDSAADTAVRPHAEDGLTNRPSTRCGR